MLPEFWEDSNTLQLVTDSSASVGYGAILDWFYGKWPMKWRSYDVIFLEYYPIIVAFSVWAHKFKNKKMMLVTDNAVLDFVINKCTSKDSKIMIFVRKLVVISLHNNILFKSQQSTYRMKT